MTRGKKLGLLVPTDPPATLQRRLAFQQPPLTPIQTTQPLKGVSHWLSPACQQDRMPSTGVSLLTWCTFDVCLHSASHYSQVLPEWAARGRAPEGPRGTFRALPCYCELTREGLRWRDPPKKGDQRKTEAQKCAFGT